jgi:CubicO group peptidase (beta-lactamase class C family)
MKSAHVTSILLAAVVLCATGHAAPAQTTVPKPPAPQSSARVSLTAPPEAAAIDRLFRGAAKPGDPGMAVIVVRKGRTLHRAAYGMANLELGVAMKPEHVFRIGSVTKQFTSAAIMMLAEEGKLAVSDPITKFLPDYPTQGKTITVEHLLTHTSGIQSYTDMPAWRGKWRQDMTVSELVDLFKNEPMQFAPGEKWRYNNSGYILLGAIIEKASGKAYADFVRERIFKPAGMTHTRYDVTEDIIPQRAAGYGRTGDHFVNAQYLSMTQPYAAGALVSTVDDLAKWEAALGAGRIVGAGSLAKIFAPYKLSNGEDTHYGYGWQISQYAGLAVQEHGGGIPGFRAYVLRIPSDGVYVAVLSNLAAAQPDPDLLARKAAAIAIGKPLVNPKAIALTAEQLEAYVGRYATSSGTRYVVSREGARLFVQSGDGAKTELFLAGNDVFFVKDAFTRFAFQRDAAGKYVRLEIDDWGPQPPATRDTTPEAVRTAVKVDPAVLKRYEGEYELVPGFVITIKLDGEKLMAQATGQPSFEIFPSSPTEFFLKVVDAQITFVKDASGAVTQLVLHQGGRDMPGKRIR